MKPIHRFGIFSIFVSMTAPLAAQTWTGATSASWSVATNWTPNAVPAEGSNITIADTTSNGITLNDGSHSVGSVTVGTTGTRTSGFTINTTAANALTIKDGVVANGNFTTGIGARFRGHTVIATDLPNPLSNDQTWRVAGQPGDHAADRGIAFNEITGSPAVVGSVTLQTNLLKVGTGQLTMGAVNVTGAGDIKVDDGSLKLNAGGSLPLTLGGTGKIVVNNTATLILSQNSGTFDVTRPIQFNLGAGLVTGSGSNGKTGDFVIASNMEWNGIHTITANNDNNNTGDPRFIFTGVMSGPGTITKAGPRTIEFAGTSSNTIATDITISEGLLRLNKTGAIAVPGNIVVAGGTLRKLQADQIADTSTVTVTSGAILFNAAAPDTIAALNISSGAISSLSGFNVTGATTITAGVHQVNSGQTFASNSLSLSNSTLQFVGNATPPDSSNVFVGAGGLTLANGTVQFGDPNSGGGNASTSQINLAGDVTTTGTSRFTAVDEDGQRVIDLQGGSRTFAVEGSLEIVRATVQNGTLVKTGTGTLSLGRPGSSANFSFTGGDVILTTPADAGNVTLSGGALRMDLGGATPHSLTTSGDFTSTGGTIEISSNNGFIAPGVHEIVSYGGNLVGTPTINIPAAVAASRMNPVVDYGTGSNSAITLTSAAIPISLVWHGALASGLWDTNNTANFNNGTEKFFALDSVTFDDTAASANVLLNSTVVPTNVLFDHGDIIDTYTVTGTGGIGGNANLTKNGFGTTILATDNTYTGTTDILDGYLKVGNGGATGSLGSGPVQIGGGTTLEFARAGNAIVGNTISGFGDFIASGPGTVALTANSNTYSGFVHVTGGTLQFGDGGPNGSLGTGSTPITIDTGSTLAIKRTGAPDIPNPLDGGGALSIVGGSPNITGFNIHEGGVSVSEGGVIRFASDSALGEWPFDPIPDAIRLNFGGMKNLDSFSQVDEFRGVAITGEAYFTAGWTKELTIGGPITGTGNIFINYDSGTVRFTNPASDWQGVLTLGADKPGFTGGTGGRLEVAAIHDAGVPGPLGNASADPANLVFNGGRLIYNGAAASTNRGFTLQTSGVIENASTLTLSGLATGPGSLSKAGLGTLVLSGNNDYTGGSTLTAGTTVLASPNGLGDTAALVRFTGTSTSLDLATDVSVAPYSFTIGAGNAGTIRVNRATTGPGITHNLGALELSNITLTVAAGDNVDGGDPRATFTSVNVSAGAAGTLTLFPSTANMTIGPASIESGNFAKTLSLSGLSMDNHATGTISDGLNVLSLRKFNDGLWTISGNNTFTGNVTVDDGVLVVAHSNALGDPAKTVIAAGNAGGGQVPELRFSGGISPTVATVQTSGAGVDGATGVLRNISGNNTLNVTNQVTLRTGVSGSTFYSDAGTFTINTPLVSANATNRFLTLDGPGNGVINGVIANGTTANLPVTKNGTGTWSLNGAHTYTGATTVNAGTLSLGQAALSDTAAVVIGEQGTLHLNFTGSADRVGSLTINGEVKADGVYDSTTDPGFITGTGSIRVGPEPSGYGTWASAYPFTPGVNDGANDDPDGDGIPNLLEYVLGGVPVGAGAGDTSILPSQTLTATDLILTFRRSDASESDVTLKVQWSANMGSWTDFATIGPVSSLPQVQVTEDSPTPELDTIVVTIPRSLAPGGKIFARLQAVK